MKSLGFSHWILLLLPVINAVLEMGREESREAVYAVGGLDLFARVQISIVLLCGVYILFFAAKSQFRAFLAVLLSRPMVWIFLYFIFALTSTIWAAFPQLALFRSAQCLIFLAVAVHATISLGSMEEAVKFQLLYALVVVVCDVVNFGFFDLPVTGLTAIGLHKRGLHTYGYVPLVILGWSIHGKVWKLITGFLSLWMIITRALKNFVGLIIGGVMVDFGVPDPKVRLLRWLGLFLMVSFLCWIIIFDVDLDDTIGVWLDRKPGTISTATGRIPAWEWLFKEAYPKHPIIGYGFPEGEFHCRLASSSPSRLSNSHNYFLSALLDLGIIGFIFSVLFLFDIFRAVVKMKNVSLSRYLLAATVTMVIVGMAAPGITSLFSLPWISHGLFYSMIAVGYLRYQAKPGTV